MLLFTCDYAIFYAPIMLEKARNYAPNYANYAQIMPIMLQLHTITYKTRDRQPSY